MEEEPAEVDEELFATVMGYLTIEPKAPDSKRAASKKAGDTVGKSVGDSISLDDFVTITFPLIDLEKQAEIAQVRLQERHACDFFCLMKAI